MHRFYKRLLILLLVASHSFDAYSQNQERPFIWVSEGDKAEILTKIQTQDWAKSFYSNFKKRLDIDIYPYKKSPVEFISKIPFDWTKQTPGLTPPLKVFYQSNGSNSNDRYSQFKYMQIGVDCGVMYFLTEEEVYAQCASDILNAFVEGLTQLKFSEEKGNGGWIYPTDHLREARVIGAQLPIIYDFVASYLKQNNTVLNIASQEPAQFSFENAQKVFLTYAKLAVEHGQRESNWSVLESYSLVQNALALDDLELRKRYLDYYLSEGSDRQDALTDFSKKYKKEGDVFPETSQYSNVVASYTTPLLYMLNKYDSTLKLGQKYYKIPFALDRWNAVRYPNDEIVRFGDGKRTFYTPYVSYDMAYLLGQQDNVPKLTDKFGPLLTEGIEKNKYSRAKLDNRSAGIAVYKTPLRLLWLNTTKKYKYEEMGLTRTDKVAHAGLFLQRNLSETGDLEYGLMCFVGGAHMIHGHASGMDMELFGLGEVLGVDHGRGKYRTDMHENYSRLFAAHNSVIVNGASQGQGGWVNLGINSTELISMEPKPLEKAISPNYSYTRTKFIDDKGDKAEATQERTMALIRTSPTTGFYVDVFRSKSDLPNEYHDYLYHNIGDQLVFFNKDLNLKAEENRFMANANDKHIQNGRYRNPGWHFFEDVLVSANYESDVSGTFEITKLKDKKSRLMNFFVLGNKNREYTKVMAPKTYDSPKPYDELPTPTLVIRQKGEAWTHPFAVVYEPTFYTESHNGIESVSKIENKGLFKGFKVVSNIDNKSITQYIINQDPGVGYVSEEIGLDFRGSFAVITFGEKGKLQNLYIGNGRSLKMHNVSVGSNNNSPISVYIDFTKKESQINASNNAVVQINKE